VEETEKMTSTAGKKKSSSIICRRLRIWWRGDNTDKNFYKDLEIDSIKAIEITVAIEKQFNISAGWDVPNITTVKQAVDLWIEFDSWEGRINTGIRDVWCRHNRRRIGGLVCGCYLAKPEWKCSSWSSTTTWRLLTSLREGGLPLTRQPTLSVDTDMNSWEGLQWSQK